MPGVKSRDKPTRVSCDDLFDAEVPDQGAARVSLGEVAVASDQKAFDF